MGCIYFKDGYIRVSDSAFKSWFPSWAAETGRNEIVNGEDIIQEIHENVTQYIHDVGRTTIRETLRQLLKIFQRSHVGFQEQRIHSCLHALLLDDVQMVQSSGTKKTRQAFLILACLARITASDSLAEAILGFLRQHILQVVAKEKPERYGEWAAARQQLRGLEDDTVIDQLAAYLLRWGPMSRYDWPTQRLYDPHMAAKLAKAMLGAFEPNDYRRGRPKRHSSPYCWPVRARSAPAYRYDRYVPDTRVGFPIPISLPVHRHRYLPPPSPRIPLPLPLPTIEYVDDYEDLRAEQDAQADEVDDLRRRVQRLEWEQ